MCTISKILIYISVMMSFRNLTLRKFNKSAIYDKLSSVPSIIIDGLLSRFTETPRGSTEFVFSPQTQCSNLLISTT